MDIQEFKDRLAAGTLTRRQITKALAAVGLAALTTPAFRRPAMADGEVTYFTWAGYDIPDIMQPYVKKYGGTPNFTIFGEEEEALQKMRAGFTPDIAHPCTYSVGRWRDSGLFKPIDTSRLSNYEDIWDDLKRSRSRKPRARPGSCPGTGAIPRSCSAPIWRPSTPERRTTAGRSCSTRSMPSAWAFTTRSTAP